MKLFKKSLLILPIGLLSLNLAYAGIACPPSGSCDGQKCTLNTLYWKYQKQDNVPNGTLTFVGAKAQSQQPGYCLYTLDPSNPKVDVTFFSAQVLSVDSIDPGQKWQTTNSTFGCGLGAPNPTVAAPTDCLFANPSSK